MRRKRNLTTPTTALTPARNDVPHVVPCYVGGQKGYFSIDVLPDGSVRIGAWTPENGELTTLTMRQLENEEGKEAFALSDIQQGKLS